MKLKRIKIPGWFFSPSTANRTARKGLTKYALESRLVPFTEGVLNAIIGLKLFLFQSTSESGWRTPLLSSQIINALVTRNKSAKAKNNKNAKIGWNILREFLPRLGCREKLPSTSANREKYQKTNRLKRNFSQFVCFLESFSAERTTRNVKKYFPAWRTFSSLRIFVSGGWFGFDVMGFLNFHKIFGFEDKFSTFATRVELTEQKLWAEHSKRWKISVNTCWRHLQSVDNPHQGHTEPIDHAACWKIPAELKATCRSENSTHEKRNSLKKLANRGA